MADVRYSGRLVADALQRHRIEEENKRLRELVADLPFSTIIQLQEIWERQHHEIRRKQRPHYKNG